MIMATCQVVNLFIQLPGRLELEYKQESP